MMAMNVMMYKNIEMKFSYPFRSHIRIAWSLGMKIYKKNLIMLSSLEKSNL